MKNSDFPPTLLPPTPPGTILSNSIQVRFQKMPTNIQGQRADQWLIAQERRKKRIPRRAHETLGMMYIIIFLAMHDSFMGIYTCLIIYFKHVQFTVKQLHLNEVILKIVPIQKPTNKKSSQQHYSQQIKTRSNPTSSTGE